MPTFRDSLRKAVYRIRAIPNNYGLRPYTITIVNRTHTGTYAGEGTATDTETALTEHGGAPPKVREANDEQMALGNLPRGTLIVGPITPDHPGGGTSAATLLAQAAANRDEFYYRVTGPGDSDGALYRLHSISTDRGYHYTLQLTPVSEA